MKNRQISVFYIDFGLEVHTARQLLNSSFKLTHYLDLRSYSSNSTLNVLRKGRIIFTHNINLLRLHSSIALIDLFQNNDSAQIDCSIAVLLCES